MEFFGQKYPDGFQKMGRIDAEQVNKLKILNPGQEVTVGITEENVVKANLSIKGQKSIIVPSLRFEPQAGKLEIGIEPKGLYKEDSTCGIFKLEVLVPNKLFEEIEINSKKGQVILEEGIKVKEVLIKSERTKILWKKTSVEQVKIEQKGGDVSLNLQQETDIYIQGDNMMGNCKIALGNIARIDTNDITIQNGFVPRGEKRAYIQVKKGSSKIEIINL